MSVLQRWFVCPAHAEKRSSGQKDQGSSCLAGEVIDSQEQLSQNACKFLFLFLFLFSFLLLLLLLLSLTADNSHEHRWLPCVS